ncbi:hypothetical protein IJV79_01115 [bacterium]|nr:hypothetical protein [bacterium]
MNLIYYYFFLFLGMTYFFGSIFASGWEIIPGNMLDGRLANYIMEHIYLVLEGTSKTHTTFLNMPIFYPMPNILAYSDTLFSIAPIYILSRLFFNTTVSFSLTVMLTSVLNYTLFYFILRKLNYSKLLSSLGGFLYAFSYNNKITHLHIQLVIQFFSLGAVLALLHVSKFNSKKKNLILFMSTATLYAMQFYSSFYIGFFVFVLILIGLFCSMFNRAMRKRIKIFCCRYKTEIIISGAWALLLVAPLAWIYLGTNLTRDYNIILFNAPTLSYLFKGDNLIINKFIPIMLENFSIELMLMFTYLLFIFGLIGLARIKKYGKLLVAMVLVACVLIIKFKYGQSVEYYNLWAFVYKFIPGGIAIREPIRFILILNPILVLGFINFLKTSKLKTPWLVILALLVVFEQYTPEEYNRRYYSMEHETQEQLEQTMFPVGCKYLDVEFETDDPYDVYIAVKEDIARMDLMWFTTNHDIFFVSGYTGIAETDGFKNPHREKLKSDPRYCLLRRKF